MSIHLPTNEYIWGFLAAMLYDSTSIYSRFSELSQPSRNKNTQFSIFYTLQTLSGEVCKKNSILNY